MIYEYQCAHCEHVQEEIHGMNDNPDIKCEKCGKESKRIITGGSGVIFKGGGWTTSDSKFKQSMGKKSEKMGRKAKDHVQSVTNLKDLPHR